MSKIIEWEEMPWNPVKGCNPVSTGCAHCYALKRAKELQASGNKRYVDGFELRFFPDLLNQNFDALPPTNIFAGSMTDFMHDEIPDEVRRQVFRVIHANPKHLFLVVTKRAEKLIEARDKFHNLPNLLLGVTVEHPKFKDRIRILQETNAINKVVFFEPLLADMGEVDLTGIKWAFVGGESGYDCRSMEKSWVLNLKSECDRQGCTFIFKQWGGKFRSVRGALLDGKYYEDYPTARNYREKL